MSTPDPRTAKPEDFPNTVLSAPPGGPGALALPPLAQPGPRQPDSPEMAKWLASLTAAQKDIQVLHKALLDHGDEFSVWLAEAREKLGL